MSHTIFSVLKIPILSHKLLRTRVQPKYKIPTKHCCVSIVRAINATETKIALQMSTSFDPFQFYTRKILYPRYFSPVACIPRKVIRHMTSDFDVCEIDMKMQMSFLNASPLHASTTVTNSTFLIFCLIRLCFCFYLSASKR